MKRVSNDKPFQFSNLEKIATQIKTVRMESKRTIADLQKKRKLLDEYAEKKEIQRRFAELRGKPFQDKSSEIEAEIGILSKELNKMLNEERKFTIELLRGLSKVPLPIIDKPKQERKDLIFSFEENVRYSSIFDVIADLLDYEQPITVGNVVFTETGLRVVNEEDVVKAMEQVIDATDKLRTSARAFADSLTQLPEVCKRIRESKRWRFVFEVLLESAGAVSTDEADQTLSWGPKTTATALSQLITHFIPPLAKRVGGGKYELSKYGQIVAKKYMEEQGISISHEREVEDLKKQKGKTLANYVSQSSVA